MRSRWPTAWRRWRSTRRSGSRSKPGTTTKGVRLAAPETRMVETTVGRVFFNRVLPPELHFVNRVLDKGSMQELVGEVYHLLREDGTPAVVDAIKDIGFQLRHALRARRSPSPTSPSRPRRATSSPGRSTEAEIVSRDYRAAC